MSADVIISSKGQITLPKSLRERLGLVAGDVVVFTAVGRNLVVTPKSTNFNDLAGLLGAPPQGGASLEEIDKTVAREAGKAAAMPATSARGQAA